MAGGPDEGVRATQPLGNAPSKPSERIVTTPASDDALACGPPGTGSLPSALVLPVRHSRSSGRATLPGQLLKRYGGGSPFLGRFRGMGMAVSGGGSDLGSSSDGVCSRGIGRPNSSVGVILIKESGRMTFADSAGIRDSPIGSILSMLSGTESGAPVNGISGWDGTGFGGNAYRFIDMWDRISPLWASM